MHSKKIFNKKKIIVTGHTGFKGSWLTEWLKQLGANVMGISLKNLPTNPSHFISSKINSGIKDVRLDIRDRKKLEKKIIGFKPDFVFHLAAQPLVGLSYRNPIITWETNVFGTLNVLQSLRKLKKACNVVIITSDKCYFNKEKNYGYKENDILGGKDPYSSSKASAELLVKSYVNSFFSNNKSKIRIVTARAGNVIGGGDWSKDRIIPDCIRCWSKRRKAQLRNPKATRPWQHVLEAVGGYICLAVNLKFNKKLHGESFNFGPKLSREHSVLDLVKSMGKYWNNVSWKKISKSKKKFYESKLLRLNCNKAKKFLKWESVLKFDETIEMVINWYRNYYSDSKNINYYTKKQIAKYQFLVSTRGSKWGKIL